MHIQSGQFVSLLGPNGAGKTTLLKILSLLSKPTSGELLIDGQPAQDNLLHLRRRIGVISHNTFLYDNLSAYENLKFYGRMYDVANLEQRIHQVIKEVGLQYVLSDPVLTFSRGMQQRLSIARAIIHDPDILFLDEPYTGLDPHAIEILNNVLMGLSEKERTIFLVTHNFRQGLEMSDMALILVKGRIVYRAEKNEIDPDNFKQVYLRHVEGTS